MVDGNCDASDGWFDPMLLLSPPPLEESIDEMPPCIPYGAEARETPVSSPALLLAPDGIE